jgi:hypothetical protein
MALALDQIYVGGDVLDVLEDCDQLGIGLGKLPGSSASARRTGTPPHVASRRSASSSKPASPIDRQGGTHDAILPATEPPPAAQTRESCRAQSPARPAAATGPASAA